MRWARGLKREDAHTQTHMLDVDPKTTVLLISNICTLLYYPYCRAFSHPGRVCVIVVPRVWVSEPFINGWMAHGRMLESYLSVISWRGATSYLATWDQCIKKEAPSFFSAASFPLIPPGSKHFIILVHLHGKIETSQLDGRSVDPWEQQRY